MTSGINFAIEKITRRKAISTATPEYADASRKSIFSCSANSVASSTETSLFPGFSITLSNLFPTVRFVVYVCMKQSVKIKAAK